MIKKRAAIIILFFSVLFSICNVNAALGLTPALIEVNYEPGLEFSASFTTISVAPDQKINIYSKGDFAEYVTFSKREMTGAGTVEVNIKLPENAKKPGKNRLYIGVIENKSTEDGIGTAVAVEALIIIHVPYPGQYAEISFSGNDVNYPEPVNFILEISNLGREDINTESKIEIHSSDGKLTETLNLDSQFIETQKKVEIKKTFDTLDYKPGPYKAIAIVNYGNTIKAESDFRIGQLYVDILNWTSKARTGKINEFLIGVESRWNSEITNIYAEVNITKDNLQMDNFKTPSVSLKPWETATLKGFINVENIESGIYNGTLILFYENKTGKKTFNLKVEEPPDMTMIAIIAGIIIFLIMGTMLVYYIKTKYSINIKKHEARK